MLALGILGTVASAAGTLVGASAAQSSANAQAAGLRYQADVAKQKGMAEQAVAQRNALENDRKVKYTQSQLQARAAASGAGASDTNILGLSGDIAKQGAYQSTLALWQGQEQKWDYGVRAQAYEANANAVQQGGKLSALGTLLGGAGSMFKAFNSFASFGGSTAKNEDPPEKFDWLRYY